MVGGVLRNGGTLLLCGSHLWDKRCLETPSSINLVSKTHKKIGKKSPGNSKKGEILPSISSECPGDQTRTWGEKGEVRGMRLSI